MGRGRRRAGGALLAGAVILASGWLLTEPAGACLCGEVTSAEAVEGADVAFVGTVVEQDPGDWRDHPPGLPVTTYAVDRVFAGEVPERVEVMQTGTDCNERARVGLRALVFASYEMEHPRRDLEEDQVADRDCGGSRPLAWDRVPADLGRGSPPTPLPARSEDTWLVLGAFGAVLVLAAAVVVVRHRAAPARQGEDEALRG
jgi:hypothetical protein